MKRITVFEKGRQNGGKILSLNDEHSDDGEDLNNLLRRVCIKLDIDVAADNDNLSKFIKLYNKFDGEIDDVSLIQNDDVLYVSKQRHEDASAATMMTEQHCKCCKYNSGRRDDGRDWITLNVGGQCFTTTRSTLTEREPNSMLARMFNINNNLRASVLDVNGCYLIDRSPTYFEVILNYLRNGVVVHNRRDDLNGILLEAKYYNIETMIPQLEEMIHNTSVYRETQHMDKNVPQNIILTRYDIIRTLINTSHVQELRFQGVHLTGANLTKLDLRNINFKYSTLTHCTFNGANLSFCCFERADLSNSNLENVQLLGVKALCANFENCIIKNSNFEDPSGVRANLEGCNLKNATLEGSNMAGVNLRVATLKHANLKNCDLRSAVLAGADLECCDLSGSDLQEANLRGANLKDAAFELMLTPLHMSQTIR